MEYLFGLGFGLAIGWLIPTPQWFLNMVQKLKDFLNSKEV